MPRRSPDLNVMIRAAERAGRALIRDFGEIDRLQVSRKGLKDFVKTADQKSKSIVTAELKKGRPEFGFVTEEGKNTFSNKTSQFWLIDPLVGTTNFCHGLPHFCVSIGLARDNQVIAGVIFDPIKDEIFWTERGIGAFVNNKRLRVSGRARLEDALLSTGTTFNPNDDVVSDLFIDQLRPVLQNTAGIRYYGVSALDLAYVAAGRYEGYWGQGLNEWEVASGVLLVREAGGFVLDSDGNRYELGSNSILATNQGLHQKLVELLIRKNS